MKRIPLDKSGRTLPYRFVDPLDIIDKFRESVAHRRGVDFREDAVVFALSFRAGQ